MKGLNHALKSEFEKARNGKKIRKTQKEKKWNGWYWLVLDGDLMQRAMCKDALNPNKRKLDLTRKNDSTKDKRPKET